jgi:AraC-like DNA-binding protein
VVAVARAARLSLAHFSREFRRTFGEAPHQYLLTRRLERAAALLRNTDRTVTEICFAVGLSSVGSFVTSFRRVHGLGTSCVSSGVPAMRLLSTPGCSGGR